MGSHSSRNATQDEIAAKLGKGLRHGGFLNDLSHMDEQDIGKSCVEWLASSQDLVVLRKADVNKEFLRRAITKELGIGAQAHNHHFNEACTYCVNRTVTAVLRQLGLEP